MARPLMRRTKPSPSRPSPSGARAQARLDAIAAGCTPPARVEHHNGDALDPPLLRAVVDLTRRNMHEYVGGAWDENGKREELTHGEMRYIAVRAGRQLVGFAAWRLTHEEGVLVGYLYELQLETIARGMGLGSGLLSAVESAARSAGAHGVMLTVHTRNQAARRFYKSETIGFQVSPMSPAACAPPIVAEACDYEILQKLWDDDSRRLLLKKGAAARRANYLGAIEDGRFKVRCVMKTS